MDVIDYKDPQGNRKSLKRGLIKLAQPYPEKNG